ncbi:zinc ribbon domain-containing protein [Nitratidesulfovibrio sp. HK-II]|uniref:hypothetical protein n=1 Tax=Nitratidesulfovibrio sp. HK-II TaxID=2009266 RepID=UPI0011C027EF|nr:hypothetical protein [Nitratidesulfovibrio sp. HK-II]
MENSWQSPKARKLVWGAFAFLVIVALLGQVAERSRKPPTLPQLADSVPQEARERLAQAWPKMLKACPGLDRYYDALTFKGVEMGFPELNGVYANLVFSVPMEKSSVPVDYMVFGHTCFFGVTDDGKGLIIPKRGCQALCLNRVTPEAGPVLHLPLN